MLPFRLPSPVCVLCVLLRLILYCAPVIRPSNRFLVLLFGLFCSLSILFLLLVMLLSSSFVMPSSRVTFSSFVRPHCIVLVIWYSSDFILHCFPLIKFMLSFAALSCWCALSCDTSFHPSSSNYYPLKLRLWHTLPSMHAPPPPVRCEAWQSTPLDASMWQTRCSLNSFVNLGRVWHVVGCTPGCVVWIGMRQGMRDERCGVSVCVERDNYMRCAVLCHAFCDGDDPRPLASTLASFSKPAAIVASEQDCSLLPRLDGAHFYTSQGPGGRVLPR